MFAEAAAGVPSFLFTDIVDSTRLWQIAPEGMARALPIHETIIAGSARRHGGRVFKQVGDQCCVIFRNPEAAIMSTVETLRELIAADWQQMGLPSGMRTRFALNAGPAEVRDGDYFGTTLNRVSRLLEIGHGDQILVSDSLVRLLGDSSEDFRLLDLGNRVLPDIAGNERIYQVVAPGLPDHFPPLKSVDERPHNLRPSAGKLFERGEWVSQLKALLLDPANRLITLTGPGGVGKTTLANAVGWDLLDQFNDGVWFVDLTEATNAPAAIDLIARAIGLRQQSDHATKEIVSNWLQHREILMLLDNCEHLIPGISSVVSELLIGSAGLKVLATSREPLRLRDERRMLISPLSVPSVTGQTTSQIAASPAVEMLVDRAAASGASIQVTSENAEALAEICERLDGLPLAIELAAPYLATIGPDLLLRRLNRSLDLLGEGPVDLPERQRSMRAAVQASDELLATDERELWQQLSLFAGSWTAEAAAQLPWGAKVQRDVDWASDELASLARRSLIIAHPELGESGRYSMLETLRRFAREGLERSGALEPAREAWISWFVQMADRGGKAFHGPENDLWLQRLDDDHANLDAVLTWLADAQMYEEALQMSVDLWSFWDQRGYRREGRYRLERALEMPETLEASLHALALRLLGNCYLSDPSKAEDFYQESRSLAATAGLAEQEASALFGLGMVSLIRGRYSEALVYIEQFRTSLGTEERPPVLVSWLWTGHINCDAGRLEAAAEANNKAVSIAGRIGSNDYFAYGVITEARIAMHSGDPILARERLEAALKIAEASGDIGLTVISGREMARSYLPDNPAEARKWLEPSLDDSLDWDDEREVVAGFEVLAQVLAAEGQHFKSAMTDQVCCHWRSEHGAPKPNVELASYRSQVDESRHYLNAQEVDDCDRIGRSMTLAELYRFVQQAYQVEIN